MQRPAIFGTCLASAIVGFCIVLTTGLVYAQTSQEQANSAPAIHGELPAVLVKSLDSKKLKEGDVVVCQTAGRLQDRSGKIVPAGSKIIGHVTQAQARSKGDPQSSLAIVFDKVQVGKNEEIPIKGVLQAVAPGLANPGFQNEPAYPPRISGPGGPTTTGPPGVPTGPPTGAPTVPPDTFPQAGQNPANQPPLLNSESKGVLGFHNLQMDDKSVLTSTGKEVRLDSGTQMMIRAE